MEGFNSYNDPVIAAADVERRGRIQGVGFRPFLYRLAMENGVAGWVRNCTSGVQMHIEAPENVLSSFLKKIFTEAPAAAKITSLHSKASENENHTCFSIVTSKDNTGESGDAPVYSGEIPPDFAVCRECLNDMEDTERRFEYLFTNCTNCGPRFTIIKGLPYDRSKTTMEPFPMCKECRDEYGNILNRRFHAQPVSCRSCGPEYSLHLENSVITGSKNIIMKTGNIIKAGGVAAIKGTGGFHLACDPFNREAVIELRRIKNRDGKPFALMFADIDEVKKHCNLSRIEESALTSVEAPIILLDQLETSNICTEVNRGLGTLGCFLPYTPFYHLFFKLTGLKAVVLTSANISGSPIIKDNLTALDTFGGKCGAVVTYNREIYNRCDDSVGRVIGKDFTIIRRSRGYVPESIPLAADSNGIFAAGGELKNTFCMGIGERAVLSQHTGNLKNPETYDFYISNIERFKDLFNFTPSIIVHDLHPGYLSTVYAKEQAAGSNIPVLAVQHHHAHIASCMAENGVTAPVIGFSFDGTGLGDDGNIWGGEIFICDQGTYERKFHLQYSELPGGDAAVAEPWKTAAAMLYRIYGTDFMNIPLDFIEKAGPEKLGIIRKMIDNSINTPLTSSAGRLFDAAAALMNICTSSSFEAEAPMRLEAAAGKGVQDFYPMPLDTETGEIRTSEMIKGMVQDITSHVPREVISAKFHNSIIMMTAEAAEYLGKKTGIRTTALSGGVFLNRYLSTGCKNVLESRGFQVLTHSMVSPGDGGLSLGQLAVGSKTLG